jgi:hypothetical protein
VVQASSLLKSKEVAGETPAPQLHSSMFDGELVKANYFQMTGKQHFLL